MGISFRKRVKLAKGFYMNISPSGASLSLNVGPLTLNSRGGATVNFGNGMTYRKSLKKSSGKSSKKGRTKK